MRLLRSNNAEGQELLAYIEERVQGMYRSLSVPLLTEREADTFRGRIAELQKLKSAVQNLDTGDEA